MKRSQSMGVYNQRQSPLPSNGGFGIMSNPAPNAQAAAAGRALLGMPKPTSNANFSAPEAASPVPRLTTEVTLKSCISSNSPTSLLNTYNRRSGLGIMSNPAPDAQAAAAGRALLGRPKPTSNANFTASAAASPVSRFRTDVALKSCISSNSTASLLKVNNRRSSTTNCKADGSSPNEEFKMSRNVSFSHLQIREYEVTLGDNPSVSSGPPVSLGWRYDPKEKILNLNEGEPPRLRKTTSEFRLSGRERQKRIQMNAYVSVQDLSAALRDVTVTKLERKQTLHELMGFEPKNHGERMTELRRQLIA